MHVLNIKVGFDAGGGEEEINIVRYYQNYPQYKIMICNVSFTEDY